MADKMNKQEQNSQDIQELFAVLDRLENVSNADEVEEILIDRGEVVPIRPMHIPRQNPEAVAENTSDLLIPVGDFDEDEEDGLVLEQADSLLEAETDDRYEEDLPPAPDARSNPIKEMGSVIVPVKGDRAGMVVRKVSVLLSVIAILAAVAYLAMDFYLMPKMNKDYYDSLAELYRPDTHMIASGTRYPDGMLASFKDLYKLNPEVRGWLSFHADGDVEGLENLIHIEYPILYSGDNDKYRNLDFGLAENKNGALFFDQKNDVETRLSDDRVLIVHGNTVANGQMMSGLNRLVGNVAGARLVPTFTMSTLFKKEEYVVFAVLLYDEDQGKTVRHFNPWRTNFVNEEDFLSHVENIRDRSLFNYPVNVKEGDSLVILSAPTGKTGSELNDGRVLVVARRRRMDEEDVVTKRIIKNRDVIMPYNWYVNQDKRPHDYYLPQARPTTTTSATGTLATSTTTTTTTMPSGTATGTGTDTTAATTTTTGLLSGIQQQTVPQRR